MKKHLANASIVPDKRREKDGGALPIKLRITFKGQRKYYATGIDATKEELRIIQQNAAKGPLKKTALALAEIEINAQKCCESITNFSFGQFEKEFFPKQVEITDLKTAFDSYTAELRKKEQIGSAAAYDCACTSLHKFKRKILLEQITPDFLNGYEKWYTASGRSITTVGIHLRALRSVLNYAIQGGLMSIENYPFGKRKYIIPSGRNIKKALTLEEIAKIYHYPAAAGSTQERCRDYWIFIYLCNGLNVKDLCLLRYRDISGDFIIFHRAKTIRTRRANPQPIRISLKDEARRIIEKWGNKPKRPDSFIFPGLTDAMTPEKQFLQIRLMVRLINDHIKVVVAALDIDKPVTTYYARHSFATILKNSGVSTEFISEALGHSSLATTKNYLAGFEQDAIKKATDILVSFTMS